ncbi:hypothetical protein H4R24_005098 [Coemansia sp. RSA 988]|nr:hypothetical protein H4R24_005098 [Coemansia sp. RSA 988]
MAELAAGISLGLAATGASLAALANASEHSSQEPAAPSGVDDVETADKSRGVASPIARTLDSTSATGPVADSASAITPEPAFPAETPTESTSTEQTRNDKHTDNHRIPLNASEHIENAAVDTRAASSAHSFSGSEPEMIELAEGSGFESSSPYEFVNNDEKENVDPVEDAVTRSVAETDTVPHADADPAINVASTADEPVLIAEAASVEPVPEHTAPEPKQLDSLLQMVPGDVGNGQLPAGDDAERIAPVVIGTVESVSLAEAEQACTKPTPAPIIEMDSTDEIAAIARSMSSLPGSQISEALVAPVAPALALDDDGERSIDAAMSTPQSQISYNRPGSQASLSDAVHTLTQAENASGRGLAKRDSAIYMDKQSEEESTDLADAAPAVVAREAAQDQIVPEPARAQDGEDRVEPSPYSSFSTPAFPQFFSQPEFQEQGAGISRREVPRASTSGIKRTKSGRPKDVLMELNIETPHDGRQLLQLRANDNLDDQCELFCEDYNMMDLLPGMKTLVRGKVERRLSRRRERALHAVAAKGKQQEI